MLEQLAVHSGGDRLLYLRGYPRTQPNSPGHFGSAAASKEMSARVEIVDGFAIVVDGVDGIGWNGASNADFDFFAFLLKKFLEQKSAAQFWVNHAEKLESDAIVTAEIYR